MGGMLEKEGKIVAKTSTWIKDSYGLYDYETKQATIKEFTISQQCTLIRNKQDVVTTGPAFSMDKSMEDSKVLASIGYQREHFWIFSPFSHASPIGEKVWIALRDYANIDGTAGYKMQVGDLIKLGRCEISVTEKEEKEERKITELHDNTRVEPEISPVSQVMVQSRGNTERMEVEAKETKAIEQKQEEAVKAIEENRCRVCLGSDNLPSNPLFDSPCSCTGSIKLMHIQCFKNWLQSKITVKKTEFAVTYNWTQFECEVCKKKYPEKINGPDGQEIEIVKIEKPVGNYLLLRADNTTSKQQVVNIIMTSKPQTLKIGRGHEADLKIPDISVSRVHAEVRVENGECYLADLRSKFGTLIRLKGALPITSSQKLKLQAGRTLLDFQMKSSKCCGCFATKAREDPVADLTSEELQEMRQKVQIEPPADSVSQFLNVH